MNYELDDELKYSEDESKLTPKKPNLWEVIILNDDFTPMEFVVNILVEIFHLNEQIASNIMMDIHQKGKASCGTFTYDIAETKAEQVKNLAKEAEYPLFAIIQELN